MISIARAGIQAKTLRAESALISCALNTILGGIPSYEQTSLSLTIQNTGIAPTEGPFPYATVYAFIIQNSSNFINPEGTSSTLRTAVFNSPAWGTLPVATNPTNAKGNSYAMNGWQIGGGIDGIAYWCGLAKNTTASPRVYYILEQQNGFTWQNSFGTIYTPGWFFTPGVNTLIYTFNLIKTGIIMPGKVIGAGQDIDLPYPPDPYPLINVGNNGLQVWRYYGIIGGPLNENPICVQIGTPPVNRYAVT
jgi:hypothetical protein